MFFIDVHFLTGRLHQVCECLVASSLAEQSWDKNMEISNAEDTHLRNLYGEIRTVNASIALEVARAQPSTQCPDDAKSRAEVTNTVADSPSGQYSAQRSYESISKRKRIKGHKKKIGAATTDVEIRTQSRTDWGFAFAKFDGAEINQPNLETQTIFKIGWKNIVLCLVTIFDILQRLSDRSHQENSGVSKKKKADRIEFEKFPYSRTFGIWRMNFKRGVCSCSCFPTEAMVWINEICSVRNMDELKSSNSIFGTNNSGLRGTWSKNYARCCTQTSKADYTGKSKRHNRTIDSWKEDKMSTWSLKTTRSVEQTKLFLTSRTKYESNSTVTTCKAASSSGTKYFSSWQMFPMKTYWKMCATDSFIFPEELKPLMTLYLQDKVQKGDAVSFSQMKVMVSRYVEQKIRDRNFNTRNEDGSPQGQLLGKETQEEISQRSQ